MAEDIWFTWSWEAERFRGGSPKSHEDTLETWSSSMTIKTCNESMATHPVAKKIHPVLVDR